MSKEQEQIEKLAVIVDRLITEVDKIARDTYTIMELPYHPTSSKKKLNELRHELKTMKP